MSTIHRHHLPHFHTTGQPIFLTWRLHGSLPAGRYFPPDTTDERAFALMDRFLDTASTGPLYLRQTEVVTIVVEAIRYREDRGELDVHNYVVMPNHVHLLRTPHIDVSRLMHSLKRHTAREGNRILGLTGQRFWQDESYDRLVRGPEELRKIARYIEMNPV